MAYSYIYYSGNGSQTTFAVTFPFLDRSHVSVKVAGVTAPFTWISDTSLSINAAPASGTLNICIRRTTQKTALVTYADGSTQTAADNNRDALQALYIAQELLDTTERGITVPEGNLGYDLPTAAQMAGQYLIGDAGGRLTTGAPVSGVTVSSAMQAVVNQATLALARTAMGPWGDASVTSTGGSTARTLATRFSDEANVRDYGAVGNGVTDDTVAIQAAINSGKPVFIPAGTYICGGLSATTNRQAIYGDGTALLKLPNGAAANCILSISGSGSETTVHGLAFDGNSENPGTQWYSTHQESVLPAAVNTATDTITTRSNSGVTNEWYTGRTLTITSTGTLPAPLAAATTYWVIRVDATTIKLATSLANAQAGTAIDLTTQGTVKHKLNATGGAFSQALIQILDVNRCSIHHCRLSNSKNLGIFVGGANGGTAYQTSITHNYFNGCQSKAAVIWQGVYGSDFSHNFVQGFIRGGISIFGDNVLNPSNYSTGVRVVGNYIEFTSGVSVTGDTIGIEINNLNSFTYGKGAVIALNRVVGSQAVGSDPHWGISVDSAENVSVTGNTVEGNLVWGIELVVCKGASVVGNTVDGVAAASAGGDCCLILNGLAGPCTVTGNTFRNSPFRGVRIFNGSGGHSITGNDFYNVFVPFSLGGLASSEGCAIASNTFVIDSGSPPTPTVVFSYDTQVDGVSLTNNTFKFLSGGAGWQLNYGGEGWNINGNTLRAGNPTFDAIVATALGSRALITGNYIHTYNGIGIKTTVGGGKNAVGNNAFRTVATLTTLAGTDTSYNNTNLN